MIQIQGIPKTGEGPKEALGDENEYRVDPDCKLASESHTSAKDENGDEAAHDDHADEGHEGGGEFDGGFVGRAVEIALTRDAIEFVTFGGKGFNGGDTAQVIGKIAIENTDLLADGGIARREGFLKTDGAPDDEGHGEHGHPGDFGGGVEKDAANDGDGGDDLPDVVDADVEEEFELVDVVVEHGEQAACGAIFKVGELKMLDVVVGVDA